MRYCIWTNTETSKKTAFDNSSTYAMSKNISRMFKRIRNEKKAHTSKSTDSTNILLILYFSLPAKTYRNNLYTSNNTWNKYNKHN